MHGIGTWSQEDLVTYLKTGKLDNKAQAAGSMAEAISSSFQHLTDADLNAIATYVRSVPSANASQASGAKRFEMGAAGNEMATFRGKDYAESLAGDHAGAQIFAANCASCHGYNAQGTKDGYYPSLFHNAATAGDNAINVVSAILNGVDRDTEAGHVFMLPFGDQTNAVVQLNNAEVASLANYLLKDYGNAKLTITPEDVRVIRNGGPSSNLVMLARLGIGAGAAVSLLLIAGVIWYRIRRKLQPVLSA